MFLELFENHVYSKSLFYRKRFRNMGKNSKIWYPNRAISKKNISIGNNTQILSESRIQCYCQERLPEPRIEIGDNCYIGYYLSLLAGANIIIDDWVLMASNILITSETHGTDPESDIQYMDQPLKVAPVHIKSGTWIGEKVCIMPGVTIGKKCVIGAGSIVTKSIPDYCIAVGNPARVIKKYNFATKQWEKC